MRVDYEVQWFPEDAHMLFKQGQMNVGEHCRVPEANWFASSYTRIEGHQLLRLWLDFCDEH